MSGNEARSIIADLKRALKGPADPATALRGTFDGWTILVVSAGPSAKRWREIYDSLDHTRLAVLCVKQAVEIDDLADKCNFHVCNSWNLRRYRYSSRDILRLYVDDDCGGPSYQRWDLRLMIHLRNISPSESIAVTGAWDEWTFDKTGIRRPWGPGLMYEGVFHTLVHCGFAHIHTVGWDIADPSGSNAHFYDASKAPAAAFDADDRRNLLGRVQRRLANFWRFATGQNYNRAVMMNGEAEMVANSVPVLRRWLESKGVSLTVNSDSQWMAADKKN